MRIRVAYFSGTGGTALIARSLAEVMRRRQCDVHLERIGRLPAETDTDQYDSIDMLVLLFCVHDFNAPHPVSSWVTDLGAGSGTPTAVISVSGGGEMLSNRACRKRTIAALDARGYEVFFEDMMVMPSTIFSAPPDPMGAMLLEVYPLMTERLAGRLLGFERRRTRPPLLDRAFSRLCETMPRRSREFAEGFEVADTCDTCGWCVKKCPVANIAIAGSTVVFSDRCVACMNCVYGCPKQAITATTWKSYVVKEGFRLADFQRRHVSEEEWSRLGKMGGWYWSGARKYLQTAAALRRPKP